MLFFLSGCSSKTITPVLNTEFDLNAVYKTGDFSYSCEIVRSGGTVTVKVLSTNAAGLLLFADAKSVTYEYSGMRKTFPAEKIDKTNPAIIINEIFSSIESGEIESVLENGQFRYKGKTSAGNFILYQNKNNSLDRIVLPAAEIEIKFDKTQ